MGIVLSITARFSNPNSSLRSFSNGGRFKSSSISLRWSSPPAFSSSDKPSSAAQAATARCRLMWPPKAWLMENSRPQMEHSCILGSPAADKRGFLWPPSAWKEGNHRLHARASCTRTTAPMTTSTRNGTAWSNRRHLESRVVSDVK